MKKLTKLHQRFRALGIINTWDLLKHFAKKGEDIAISYHTRSHGAGGTPGCRVWCVSKDLNPKGAWYERGQFCYYGTRKDSLPFALVCAVTCTNTHVDDWVSNPVERGGLVLKSVVDRAMAFLKEQEKK